MNHNAIIEAPSVSSLLEVSTSVACPETAALITQEHKLAQQKATDAIGHAIRVGLLLIQVKGSLRHGEFLKWLANNVPFSERTAQNYIRLAANKDTLKSATAADLTIRGALAAIQTETELLSIAQPEPLCGEPWTPWAPYLYHCYETTDGAYLLGVESLERNPNYFYVIRVTFNLQGDVAQSSEGTRRGVHRSGVYLAIHLLAGLKGEDVPWVEHQDLKLAAIFLAPDEKNEVPMTKFTRNASNKEE